MHTSAAAAATTKITTTVKGWQGLEIDMSIRMCVFVVVVLVALPHLYPHTHACRHRLAHVLPDCQGKLKIKINFVDNLKEKKNTFGKLCVAAFYALKG